MFHPRPVGQRYLAELRAKGLSVQTSNHYLRAIKQFSRWLVRDRRTHDDPLVHLSMLNVRVDRRHDRRALLPEEFSRLVDAAHAGPPVVCIPGPDRAMMYILAAWTGYRKGEIGSLTKRSLRLDDDPPTVTVAAAYSKRKRADTQVLHPDVVARLRTWLATKKDLGPDQLLNQLPGVETRRSNRQLTVVYAGAAVALIYGLTSGGCHWRPTECCRRTRVTSFGGRPVLIWGRSIGPEELEQLLQRAIAIESQASGGSP